MFETEFYPSLSIAVNKSPNKFYALPVLGGLVKFLILTPQFIEALIFGIITLFLVLINSFVVFFTGKYWDTAYNMIVDYSGFITKVCFFWAGLLDSYPGFDLSASGKLVLKIKKPENPNRLLASPILGGVFRFIILIPYFLYSQVLTQGAWVGVVASSIPVILRTKYPESTHEFLVDAQRISLASGFYLAGLYDKYPSFKISMNNKNIKILLLIIGILLSLSNISPENY